MPKPSVLVLSGYGLNCEEETRHAFETAGAAAEIVHVNDLIDGRKRLNDYQVLAFPGGFSYGDDTGSGNAFANRLRNHLWSEVEEFVRQENLVIGICNGFQILSNLGLLPALGGSYGARQVALEHNDSARYLNRWVDLKFEGNGPWTEGVEALSVPIAHGEGRFYADEKTLALLNRKKLVAARYVKGEICDYQSLPFNPNGALEDIAGITDETGRVLGLMPHPERAIHFTHNPMWTLLREKLRREGKKMPEFGPSLKIFKNAVEYFK
ncbi:MAG TPA: phosphoribosylformylglycinamidine synthase I [archaeon]|nr:phosphoribosylformylglycinamidine synthase I [archaeon]